MKKTFTVYCIAYFLILIYVSGLQYAYPKLELHLLLNSYHTRFLDTFFKYYSTLAEWPLYVLALLPLFWKKYRITLFIALSELSSGVLLQILKHAISNERPASMFEKCPHMVLPVVEDVELHYSNSFPSGHSSTFFVFSTCCALLLAYHYSQRADQHNRWQWVLYALSMLVLLLLAILGGYSRIYLSQHFLEDVCVGSIIGFITPCLFFYFGKNKILKL